MEEVKKFLSEYKEVQGSKEHSFFSTFSRNLDLQKSIYGSLHSRNPEDRQFVASSDLFKFLFYLHRSSSPEIKKIVLQYIPSLVSFYLVNLSTYPSNSLESLLLTLYNTNIGTVDEVLKFRIPQINTNSIYHDGSRMEINTDSTFSDKENSAEEEEIKPKMIEKIYGLNRQKIMSQLLRIFNSRLGDYKKFVLDQFAQVALYILQKGYPISKKSNTANDSFSNVRVPLSSSVLLELLYGGYFCVYNGLQRYGSQVVDSVHFRGTIIADSKVILASSSAKSLILTHDLPSTTMSTPTFSQIAKNLITNASFRTKKMGDDIPVVEPVEPVNNNVSGITANNSVSPEQINKNLSAISEEQQNNVDAEETAKNATEIQKSSKAELKEKIISKFPLKKKKDYSLNSEISIKNKEKIELKLSKSKKSNHFNGDLNDEIDSLEQIEELIKKKSLPSETITIHSPESGTTLF